MVIEWRFADLQYERLPIFAEELAQMKVDAIVTHSILTTKAAQRATNTIPIVFVSMTDPIAGGVVQNLARPEGNTTGSSQMSVDVSPKHVDLLASIIPKLSRIAYLMTPLAPSHATMLRSTQAAAAAIGARVLPVEASNPAEIERGFAKMANWHAQAVIVASDPIFIAYRRQIAQLALKMRIATMSASEQDAEVGGLLSYGQDLVDFYRRAAEKIDKIIKGARPGDLPIEQPTVFQLVLNLKSAKALGIKVPAEMRMRADRVIE